MEIEPQPITLVLDEELVFRSVGDSTDHHACDSHGNLVRLGQSAFNDPDRTPSVDRESMRGGGAQESRRDPQHGVVTLQALEIRQISTVVTNNAKGIPIQSHAVDVQHSPEHDNYSHALVVPLPQAKSDGAWKKLKEALCRLAIVRGWAFRPASVRTAGAPADNNGQQ